MRTLLALVAAVAMVVAALYWRGDLGSGGGGGPLAGPEPATLVCVTELAAVCESFEDDGVDVTVEEAGVTAEHLSTDEAVDYDAWLTFGPWQELAADARRRGALRQLAEPEGVVGRSPLVMVVRAERAAVLTDACRADLTWRCIARFAPQGWADVGGQQSWGAIKPGFADPSTNATGLLVLGSVASSLLGNPDFSAGDLDSDDTFQQRFSDLAEAVPNDGSRGNTPLAQQIVLAASYDFVGTTEAEAGPLLQRTGSRAGDLQIRYPEPVGVAELVLAPLREGSGADRLQELVGESGAAVAQAGWRVDDQPLAAGIEPSPAPVAESNLPAGGVLDALRVRWEEIAR